MAWLFFVLFSLYGSFNFCVSEFDFTDLKVSREGEGYQVEGFNSSTFRIDVCPSEGICNATRKLENGTQTVKILQNLNTTQYKTIVKLSWNLENIDKAPNKTYFSTLLDKNSRLPKIDFKNSPLFGSKLIICYKEMDTQEFSSFCFESPPISHKLILLNLKNSTDYSLFTAKQTGLFTNIGSINSPFYPMDAKLEHINKYEIRIQFKQSSAGTYIYVNQIRPFVEYSDRFFQIICQEKILVEDTDEVKRGPVDERNEYVPCKMDVFDNIKEYNEITLRNLADDKTIYWYEIAVCTWTLPDYPNAKLRLHKKRELIQQSKESWDIEMMKSKEKMEQINENATVSENIIILDEFTREFSDDMVKKDVELVTKKLDVVLKDKSACQNNASSVIKVFDNLLNVPSASISSDNSKNLLEGMDSCSSHLSSGKVEKSKRIAISTFVVPNITESPSVQNSTSDKVPSVPVVRYAVFKPTSSAIEIANSTSTDSSVDTQLAVNLDGIKGGSVNFQWVNSTKLTKQEAGHKSDIVSSVISVSGEAHDNIDQKSSNPLVIVRLKSNSVSNRSVVCAFWNKIRQTWSTKGCRTLAIKGSKAKDCHCWHLANFALLMKVHCNSSFSNNEIHGQILSLTSYVFLIISSLSLIIFSIVYLIFLCDTKNQMSRDKSQSKNLVSFSLTLLSANLTFLIGGYLSFFLESHMMLCKFIGALLHYTYLSTIFWSFVEAFRIYISIVRLHYSSSLHMTHISYYFLKAGLFAWGFPAGIVLLTGGIYYGDNYGYDSCSGLAGSNVESEQLGEGGFCFLKKTPFYIAFLTPTALVLFFDVVIFALILPILLRSSAKLGAKSKARHNQSLKGLIGLVCLLSLTWIFGCLMTLGAQLVFQYIFVFSTSLQGFFVLVFFLLLKQNMRLFLTTKWQTLSTRENSRSLGGTISRKNHSSKKFLWTSEPRSMSSDKPTSSNETHL